MEIRPQAYAFVKLYYLRLCNDVGALSELYSRDATIVHGEEGDEATTLQGAPRDALKQWHWAGSQVLVTDVSVVPTTGAGSVLVVVLGEVKKSGSAPRTFTQTFVLVPRKGDKFFIFSDVFKTLSEEAPGPPQGNLAPTDANASVKAKKSQKTKTAPADAQEEPQQNGNSHPNRTPVQVSATTSSTLSKSDAAKADGSKTDTQASSSQQRSQQQKTQQKQAQQEQPTSKPASHGSSLSASGDNLAGSAKPKFNFNKAFKPRKVPSPLPNGVPHPHGPELSPQPPVYGVPFPWAGAGPYYQGPPSFVQQHMPAGAEPTWNFHDQPMYAPPPAAMPPPGVAVSPSPAPPPANAARPTPDKVH